MTIYTREKQPLGFYVYAYLREDNTPYYIGKGKGIRAWSKSKNEIRMPRNTSRIIIVEQLLTEIGALAIERQLIRWYGRKDLYTGILRNKTDGGDGTSGRKASKVIPKSESHKQNIATALTGKKKSAVHIQHCKESAALREKIKCKYCGKSVVPSNHKRWHGERCKLSPDVLPPTGYVSVFRHQNPSHKLTECEHCHKFAGAGNFSRWHGNNCRYKK